MAWEGGDKVTARVGHSATLAEAIASARSLSSARLSAFSPTPTPIPTLTPHHPRLYPHRLTIAIFEYVGETSTPHYTKGGKPGFFPSFELLRSSIGHPNLDL